MKGQIMEHRFKQLRDLASALRLHLHFRHLERSTPEELAAYQDEKLKEVVRSAVANSPFYGALCAGIDVSGEFRLQDLPITDKRMMMENFDDWVTDKRLKLADIERQIRDDPVDQYYLGEYRIAATSGSSGYRGIFVYDRPEWRVVIAAAFRWSEMFGSSPIELTHTKLATVQADSPVHVTSRLGQSMALGMPRMLMLDATQPMSDLVEELNKFQPTLFMGYASLASLLAIEQMEGRLDIHPRMLATFSELLGADRVSNAQKAWGITPFNHYGASEQVMIGAECEAHEGLHHFSDMSIVEVVDEDNNPVPPGTLGNKILLTNLHKFVQPVIRYEITDLVTQSPDPCSCGRPFPLFSQIGGRTEDIITLPGIAGHEVPISPVLIISTMIDTADVVEFQYAVENDTLKVRVVPRQAADRSKLEVELQAALRREFDTQGVTEVPIEIAFSDKFARSSKTMGKLKMRTPSVA